MKKKISVIGAGSMGVAVSVLLHNNGHDVTIWTPFEEEADLINSNGEHIQKLPGVKIPKDIICTCDLSKATENIDICILVVPSQTVRQTAEKLKGCLAENVVVACFSKGLEENTGLRMSEVFEQVISENRFVAMSGPCHAEEMTRQIPSAYVAASKSKEAALLMQDVFMCSYFRVYTSSDIIGVEMGGAIKNVIALCAGVSDGLGFGDNTKAALITRGMAEMIRLGVKMGAKSETFAGLTGMGDLVVTCTSEHSRNRRAGFLIGQGKTADEAAKEIKMVVEGVKTAKAAYELACDNNISMPIVEEAYKVIFENKNPKEAVLTLMMREKKDEI